ncbi:MAG: molybdate-binding domain-containing protein, partial [Syntrophomonadaceae bacterium]|nr:molybdate-binding domain-containing protein [Syntrophomonadaceae bacterium]
EERYDLCILPDLLDEERLDILLQTISTEEFKQNLIRTGGYNTDFTGKVIFENSL